MKKKESVVAVIRREKRRRALGTDLMCDWDFARDNGENPQLTRLAQNYVTHFEKFRNRGAGLFLYGGPGSGKSFAAAAIVNELTDRGYRCLFTSLLTVLSDLSGLGYGNRRCFLSQICDRDLLVLDDFGTEAETSFSSDVLLQIINLCRLKSVPIIVTTPYHPDALTQGGAASRRTFAVHRLLSRCTPVNVIIPRPRSSRNFKQKQQGDTLLKEPAQQEAQPKGLPVPEQEDQAKEQPVQQKLPLH